VEHISSERISWTKALKKENPLLMPVAHDGLTAKIIEQAGFTACQVGGYAVSGTRFGLPDVDLTQFYERLAAVRDIMAATDLPILVDADDGYGDVKNVTHTVRSYISIGVQGLFIEDQQAPKECGHMDKKKIVPVEQMVAKVRAADAAREGREFFILARTDALAPEGVDAAIKRAEKYLKAGADGVYVEGPTSEDELKKVGKAFKGEHLATSVLENGGKTPWLPPGEFGDMGYTMLLYPTTILFRATYALRKAAKDLRAGKEIDKEHAVDMDEFMKIVELRHWQEIEKRYQA
jgi:2-methylisocitrate lyase-like PEP mutase family enzyme